MIEQLKSHPGRSATSALQKAATTTYARDVVDALIGEIRAEPPGWAGWKLVYVLGEIVKHGGVLEAVAAVAKARVKEIGDAIREIESAAAGKRSERAGEP